MSGEVLGRLRATFATGAINGLLLPHGDEYLSETQAPHFARFAYVTSFTGSAGFAVIGTDRAALFVDGRYTLQAKQQSPDFEQHPLTDDAILQWINTHFAGKRLGFDPRTMPEAMRAMFETATARAGLVLVPLDTDPVAASWPDRPAAPSARAYPHPLAYAGVDAAEKRAQLAATLQANNLDATIVERPDEIAWLLNLRGGDVANIPIVLCRAIAHANGTVDLFVDAAKLDDTVRVALGNQVAVYEPASFGDRLTALAGKRVQIDPTGTFAWTVTRLRDAGANIVAGRDLLLLPRSIKNETERAGARVAHRRDGAVLTRFLHLLTTTQELDELQASAALRALRQEEPLFRDDSFEPVSAAGPNAALAHYRSRPATNRKLRDASIYLIDSGGQYLDGTTDVTRTVATGTPTDDQRHRFTHVLKAHIAMATARFPAGTTGQQLDAMARQQMWRAGLDFEHGTGHGVGSFLSVHEGPQRFNRASTQALLPGMIISNEPGYYREGAYGIRIENLLLVEDASPVAGGDLPMLSFETLTLAPFDRRLIDQRLLDRNELAWIDSYHARVYETLAPTLPNDVQTWLQEETRPLGV